MEAAKKTLTELMGNAGYVDSPELALDGCVTGSFHKRQHAQRISGMERQRQRKLGDWRKKDMEIGQDVFQILKAFPSLASIKYHNFFAQALYPLWYFVLLGHGLEKVEPVYEMYCKAIAMPLAQCEWRGKRHCLLLLEAACRSAWVSDAVIAFLAQKLPVATTTSFRNGPLPFTLRVLDSPKYHGIRHASWTVIDALLPRDAWGLWLFNSLLEVGYSAEILDCVLDKIIQHGDCQPRRKSIQVRSFQWHTADCRIDQAKGLVLQRLLGLSKWVLELHLSPAKWTYGGLCETLQGLSDCASIEVVGLTIKPEMMVGDGAARDRALHLLEELFATDNSLHSLSLTMEGPFLEAVMKGLARSRNSSIGKLTLFMMDIPNVAVMTPFLKSVHRRFELLLWCAELGGQWSIDHELDHRLCIDLQSCKMTPECMVDTLNLMPVASRPGSLVLEPFEEGGLVDITDSLLRVFQLGFIEKLVVKGSSTKYNVDMFLVFRALRQDTTLTSLEMEQPLQERKRKSNNDSLAPPSKRAKVIVQTAKTEAIGAIKGENVGARHRPQLEPGDSWAGYENSDLQRFLLELLKVNSKLSSVIIYDNQVDYSGFSKRPTDFRPMTFPRPTTFRDEALSDRMLYYMRLNRCGRERVRRMGASHATIVEVLSRAREMCCDDDDLGYLSTIFGLLLESAPNLWKCNYTSLIGSTPSETGRRTMGASMEEDISLAAVSAAQV